MYPKHMHFSYRYIYECVCTNGEIGPSSAKNRIAHTYTPNHVEFVEPEREKKKMKIVSSFSN